MLFARKVDVYLVSACLVSFCSVFCMFLYCFQCSVSLCRLAVLYALTLFLCSFFKCVLYHGSDLLCVIVFLGMCLSIVSRIVSRSLVQFVSTELAIGSASRNESRKSAKSLVMASMSALL